MYLGVYIYIHMCVCVYVYVYIYIYIYITKLLLLSCKQNTQFGYKSMYLQLLVGRVTNSFYTERGI